MYLSQRAQSLQESAIRKLDSAMRSYTDVSFFRLNIGQPDIETHPQNKTNHSKLGCFRSCLRSGFWNRAVPRGVRTISQNMAVQSS